MDLDDPRAVLDSLYAGTPDAVVLYDRDGLFVAANDAARGLTGYEEREVRGGHYRGHVHPNDWERVNAGFATALTGGLDHFETMVRHRDGRVIPVEIYVFPAKRGNDVIGVIAQARDIVALRSAELSLGINQDRFRSLFEFHPDGILELKRDGIVSRVNVSFERETGFLGERIVGRPWTQLVAPERRDEADDALRRSARGEAVEIESQFLDRLGDRIDVALKLVPSTVASEIRGAYVIAKNVSAQRDAERAVIEHSARVRELYLVAASRGESASEQIDATIELALRMFDFDFGYVARFVDERIAIDNAVGEGWSVAAGQMFPSASSLTRHLAEIEVLEADDLDDSPWKADGARANAPWRSYFAVRLRRGDETYGALAFAARRPRAPLRPLDRDLLQLIALFVEAAIERASYDERIEGLAFTDALTGLPNRVLFDDRIRQAIATAKRYDRGFAVMYLDVDRFKDINDELGHAAGDAVLRGVGERLRATLRESDTVARFGGDEFVVLQPIVDGPADAADLARKIVAELQTPLRVGEIERDVRISVGIALYPQDGHTIEVLMDLADRALYAAKRAGRNRWSFANEAAARAALVDRVERSGAVNRAAAGR
ncbi:MAG TPA: diguanylate cyclase [Candidatus Baltobacteraceae bacterium]|jgi:diguanylate cyclase (GGDEF)-like protein/PAS domain S-box-containing protein